MNDNFDVYYRETKYTNDYIHTNKENEMMNPNKPLSISRTKLVKVVQDSLDADADAYAHAQVADLSRKSTQLIALKQAMKDNPGGVLALVTSALPVDVTQWADRIAHFDPASIAHVPSESKEKLLRVLSLADDKVIEVTPSEDIYHLI